MVGEPTAGVEGEPTFDAVGELPDGVVGEPTAGVEGEPTDDVGGELTTGVGDELTDDVGGELPVEVGGEPPGGIAVEPAPGCGTVLPGTLPLTGICIRGTWIPEGGAGGSIFIIWEGWGSLIISGSVTEGVGTDNWASEGGGGTGSCSSPGMVASPGGSCFHSWPPAAGS